MEKKNTLLDLDFPAKTHEMQHFWNSDGGKMICASKKSQVSLAVKHSSAEIKRVMTSKLEKNIQEELE